MKKQLLTLALAWIPLLIGAADNAPQNLEQFHALPYDVQVIIAKYTLTEIKLEPILPDILRSHEDVLNSAVFSHDRTKIVSASNDGTVRIWDVNTKQSDILRGHEHFVNSAAFNHDDTKIVSASNDGTVRIWDVNTKQSDVLHGHKNCVNSAVFNHNGTKIASASNDGTVYIWDLRTGKSYSLGDHNYCFISAAFNHDDTKVVSATNKIVHIWDFLTGQSESCILYDDFIKSVAFNHDGTKIISVHNDDMIQIWNVKQLPYAQYHFALRKAIWFYNTYHGIMHDKDKQEEQDHDHDAVEISQERNYQILYKLAVKHSIHEQYPEISSRAAALKTEKELNL